MISQTKLVPEICTGKGAKFSGDIVIKVFHARDRIKLMKTLVTKVKNGEVETTNDALDSAEQMIDITESLILECNLVEKETGRKIEKEELFVYSDFATVLKEVADTLQGIKLGKLL